MITSLTLAKSQLRVTHALEDDLIQQLMGQAEEACQEYLDRYVYPDQATLDVDLALATTDMQTASDAYDAAMTAYYAMADGTMKDLAKEKAIADLHAARTVYRRRIHGMIANRRFTGAALLLLSHYYNNREAVVVGSNAKEMPLSACYLLDPDRAQLGV